MLTVWSIVDGDGKVNGRWVCSLLRGSLVRVRSIRLRRVGVQVDCCIIGGQCPLLG